MIQDQINPAKVVQGGTLISVSTRADCVGGGVCVCLCVCVRVRKVT